MYYETYGQPTDPVLVLIHGNGSEISHWKAQIDHFRKRFRVVVADSRAHGKTDDGDVALTYELMADDYNSLCDHLKLRSPAILGQSDGAIIGLILAMTYPDKFERVVAMGPSLRPDTAAVPGWLVELTNSDLREANERIEAGDASAELHRQQMHYELLAKHPHITTQELSRITIPVLVMSGDDDLIRAEHILEIYRAIPNSNLAVLPGVTHFALFEDPELFNYVAERFLTGPFRKPTSRAVLESFKTVN